MLRLLNILITLKQFNKDIMLLLILVLHVLYPNIIQKNSENE